MTIPITSYAQERTPRFEPSDCPIEVPSDPAIACGYLVVPENYKKPEGSTIRLPVITIHSRSQNPALDPILFTEGGPGLTSLSSVWWLARSQFVDDRDMVILEQRGNLYAQPSLACDVSIWWEETANHTPCLDGLNEKDIDLSQYTTANIAADIEALRQMLGYDTWNLYGASYSTQLMQVTMHLHPESIRSVILQSTSPLTENRYEHDPEHALRSIQVMLDDCAADPVCAAAYPDLETQLYTVINRLNADPVSFEFTDSETGQPFTETVDGKRLLDWMVTDAFYGPAWPPHKTAYLPLLINQVAQGNTELLYPWLNEELRRLVTYSQFAWGLYFSVNCQADASAVTTEMMAGQTAVYPQLDGYIRHARELEICKAWDLPPAPPPINEPVTSDIPTLILAGTYDPITPPEWGQAVAENLSHSYIYEFPSLGHNLDTDNPCAQSIKISFLNDPTNAPDASCIAEVPRPGFVLPEDVAIAPGVYNIVYDVDLGNPTRGRPLLEFLAGGSLVVFLLAIVYLLIAGAVWFFRRHGHRAAPDRIGRIWLPWAGLTAVLGWLLVWVISKNTNTLSHTNWTVLYFGLPLDYPPARVLAILALVFVMMTVGLAGLTAVAWRQRCRSVVERVIFTLVATTSVLFTGFIFHWDLHLLLL